jgi:hypothetical protein
VGGQTGLNLSVELAEAGVLDKYGVELIGAKIDAIKKAEDRLLFKDAMRKIGLETPQSQLVNSIKAGQDSPSASATRASCAPVSPWAAPAAASPTTRKSWPRFWSAASTSRRCTKSSSKRACSVGRNSSWR